MTEGGTHGLSIALVHHPVRSRDGSEMTTAITNLDVHDLARLARTYGADTYYVVTPITIQQELVERIVSHWRDGGGMKRIPERGEALSRIAAVPSVGAAIEHIEGRLGTKPRVVATAARGTGFPVVGYEDESRLLFASRAPTLLLFGTGHGLSDSILAEADAVLAPIRPKSDYNHLSVRTAVAITLDRLIGDASLPVR